MKGLDAKNSQTDTACHCLLPQSKTAPEFCQGATLQQDLRACAVSWYNRGMTPFGKLLTGNAAIPTSVSLQTLVLPHDSAVFEWNSSVHRGQSEAFIDQSNETCTNPRSFPNAAPSTLHTSWSSLKILTSLGSQDAGYWHSTLIMMRIPSRSRSVSLFLTLSLSHCCCCCFYAANSNPLRIHRPRFPPLQKETGEAPKDHWFPAERWNRVAAASCCINILYLYPPPFRGGGGGVKTEIFHFRGGLPPPHT